MKIIEIVSIWPCEIFIQRHIDSFVSKEVKPKLVSLGMIYKKPTSSIQPTNKKIDLIPQFDNLNLFGKIKSLRYLWNNPKLLLSSEGWQNKLIRNYFINEQPDLIHFHWSNTAVRMSWMMVELQIPFTFSLRGHDITELTTSPDYVNKLLATIKLAAGVHSVSEELWEQTKKICANNLDYIFHKTIYTTVPKSTNNLNSSKLSNHRKTTFITVARLDWSKNLVSLILAFYKYLEFGNDAILMIIGDGDQRIKASLNFWINYLLIADNVLLLGTVESDRVFEILRESDGYIQSSISEGFSNAVAEAMTLGMPVFATNAGGTEEIIIDGINGFILEVKEPENWWKKLSLINNKQLMRMIGDQALKDSIQFSPENHANNFLKFYEESIKFARKKNLNN